MSEFYTPIELTQLEAALSQLDTAICLFLLQGSPAAVHTLAGAAQEVLKGLATRHSRTLGTPEPKTVLDNYGQSQPPKNLNDLRNFLKHAQRGTPDSKTVDANKNAFWIADCLENLQALGKPMTAAGGLFFNWTFEVHSQGYVFACDVDEDVREQIYEDAGLTYPYPTLELHWRWLRKTLTNHPWVGLPEWFRAAALGTQR